MQVRPNILRPLSGSSTTHMQGSTASSERRDDATLIAVFERFAMTALRARAPTGNLSVKECHVEHVDLYEFRERAFDPAPGGWIEQEPVGYVDGINLYLAVGAPSDAKAVEIKPIEAETYQPDQHADHSST